jgi:predicted nucleic acid-binding protein
MRILTGSRMSQMGKMYLIDTNIISEVRKKSKANKGVLRFFEQVTAQQTSIFLSVVTVGELRRGVELIRYRGDMPQAKLLEQWLEELLTEFGESILDINHDIAQLWGRLRVPHPQNTLDKQIAATALIYDLIVVTRNIKDFSGTGVQLLNPFEY